MKPKPIIRLLFAIVVVVGTLICLQAAKTNNLTVTSAPAKTQTTLCEADVSSQPDQSNNEFIFFEALSKYLFIPVVR